MLIFKVAKFVLKHPLLTHGARQLVHKKTTSPKGGIPYETESSRSRIPSGGADPGHHRCHGQHHFHRFRCPGPASGAPVQAL